MGVQGPDVKSASHGAVRLRGIEELHSIRPGLPPGEGLGPHEDVPSGGESSLKFKCPFEFVGLKARRNRGGGNRHASGFDQPVRSDAGLGVRHPPEVF